MKHPITIFVRHGDYTEGKSGADIKEQISPSGLKQAKTLATKLMSSLKNIDPERVIVISSSAPRARDFGSALSGSISPGDYVIQDELWSDRDHPDSDDRVRNAAWAINMLDIYSPLAIVVITHTEFLAKVPPVLFKTKTKNEFKGTVPRFSTGQAMMLDYDSGTVVSI